MEGLASPPLVAVDRDRAWPLSYVQMLVWYYALRYPGVPAHFWHLPIAIRIQGDLDPDLLQRAFQAFIHRQEGARMVFLSQGGLGVQRVVAPFPVPLPVVDLAGLPEDARASRAEALRRELLLEPFDLALPPWRVRLLRLGEGTWELLVVAHHITCDAWTLGILFRELAALYEALREGRPDPLPPLEVHYLDYAAWHHARTAAGVLEPQIRFWMAQLSPPYPGLDLRGAHPRPAQGSYAGALHSFTLEADLRCRAEALARSRGTTAFCVYLAALYVLLHAWSDQDDLLVSVPAANRVPSRRFRSAVGCFAKHLPHRIDLAHTPDFGALLDRVHRVSRAALLHQEAPIAKAVERLGLFGTSAHRAQVQVCFIYQNRMVPRVDLPGLAFELDLRWDLLGIAREDMVWQLLEREGGLQGWLECRTELYPPDLMARLVADYRAVLRLALEDPSRAVKGFLS